MRNNLSIVIPSKTLSNVIPCIEAIRASGDNSRIIVVDDGIDWNSWPCVGLISEALERLNVRLTHGTQPFIFARNVNLGIAEAVNDDVIVLNDDALLDTPGGFQTLHTAARENAGLGLVTATTNLAGNPAQQRHNSSGLRICPSPTPGNSFATVAFVCVLIPRRTIDKVGLLDERFTAYGWEDNDYCRRVHLAGQQIGICDGCFVDHSKLHSTFRGGAYAAGDINAGRAIYLAKWGSV